MQLFFRFRLCKEASIRLYLETVQGVKTVNGDEVEMIEAGS